MRAGLLAMVLALAAVGCALFGSTRSEKPPQYAARFATPEVAPSATPALVPHQRVTVRPISNRVDDPSFEEFRHYLQDAVKRRDAQAIYRVVARDVWVTTDLQLVETPGRSPFEDFKATVGLEGKTPLWDSYWPVLEKALAYGVQKTTMYSGGGALYCGPKYAFSGTYLYPFFVVGSDVPMRDKPTPFSAVIELLFWEPLEGDHGTYEKSDGYIRLKALDSKTGWIDLTAVEQMPAPRSVCFDQTANGR